MGVASYPLLALIAGLAALVVAGSALLVRSQVADQPEHEGQAPDGVSSSLARKLSHYLFGIAALMAVLAIALELGDTISDWIGFSSAYICESVLALSFALISVIARHSYRNLRRNDGHG